MFQACPNFLAQNWREYVAQLAWKCLGVSLGELEVAGEREVGLGLLSLLPPRPGPG